VFLVYYIVKLRWLFVITKHMYIYTGNDYELPRFGVNSETALITQNWRLDSFQRHRIFTNTNHHLLVSPKFFGQGWPTSKQYAPRVLLNMYFIRWCKFTRAYKIHNFTSVQCIYNLNELEQIIKYTFTLPFNQSRSYITMQRWVPTSIHNQMLHLRRLANIFYKNRRLVSTLSLQYSYVYVCRGWNWPNVEVTTNAIV